MNRFAAFVRPLALLAPLAVVGVVAFACQMQEESGATDEPPPLGSGIKVDPQWTRQAEQTGAEETPLPDELANRRSTSDSPITAHTVDMLEPRWSFETPGNVTHRPLVDEGVVYFGDWSGSVYALNVHDGTELWSAQVQQPNTDWPWHGIVGTGAVDDQRLYQASAEGQVWALGKRTGDVIWQTRVSAHPMAGSIGTLLHHNGMLYVGLASVESLLHGEREGFEPSFGGRIVALDAQTGESAWTLDLVEPPHNGATVWSSLALDPNTNTLYFTTSYNYTGEATPTSDAIGAVDAGTGDIRWVTQVTAHDVWTHANQTGPGYAFGAGPQLFTAFVNDERRALVGAGQKSGTFWALDRMSGNIVWHNTVGYGQIGGGIVAEAGVTPEAIFVWSNNAYVPGQPATEHPANVAALDTATGRTLWHRRNVQPAGTRTGSFVVNDVYFVASLDGHIRAYRTANGETVWESPNQGSIGSSLWVSRDMLLFGTGVPDAFGGTEGTTGVHAFGLRD